MEQIVKFGKESLNDIRRVLKELNPQSILLLTGKESYSKSGAKSLLEPYLNSYNYHHCCDFENNPKIEDVEKLVTYFNKNHCDLIIAIGGGTVLDMAKLVNFFAKKAKPYSNQLNETLLYEQKIKTIVIPTTAGSGSEATHFAVMYANGIKHSIADINLKPDYVFLIPDLTYHNPKYLTATTGFDAFAQAMESFWSVNSTEKSRKIALIAMKILWTHLPLAVKENAEVSRNKVMWASYIAGKCIDLTKTTAAHALSYTFTSMYNIPHGHAVSLTLPYFLSFNMQVNNDDCNDKRGYEFVRKLFKDLVITQGATSYHDAQIVLEKFIDSIGLERSIAKLGVKKSDIDVILSQINLQRAKNNPRQINLNDLKKFFINKYSD